MAIRERPNSKVKSGHVYEVYFTYKDFYGITRRYSKSGFLTKKSAKEHEANMRMECMQNGNVQLNNRMTFNECFEEYMKIEGVYTYAPSTLCYYQYTFENYIQNGIGHNEIFKLRYKEIQKYFNEMSSMGYATLKNIKKIFNVTFKFALKNGYVPSNPMTMVTIRSESNVQNNKVFEIDEEQFRNLCIKVLQNSKHSPDKEINEWNSFNYYIALQIGWYLGLRISETLALKKEDFDLNNKTVKICRRVEYHRLKKDDIYLTDRLKTKGSKDILPLTDTFVELMKAWFRENPYDLVVCDMDGRIIHPATISRKISLCAKDIGFDFHYHMLRHSLASRLARNNISPNVAKELLRHSDITTTLGKYTHINESDKRNALHKVFD